MPQLCTSIYAPALLRSYGSSVHALQDEDGILQTDLDRVLGMATDYFASLFTADHTTEDVLTPVLSEELMSPFTQHGLLTTISALDASSCPNHGLSRQFFSVF